MPYWVIENGISVNERDKPISIHDRPITDSRFNCPGSESSCDDDDDDYDDYSSD